MTDGRETRPYTGGPHPPGLSPSEPTTPWEGRARNHPLAGTQESIGGMQSPGQPAIVMAALMLGLLLMGIQLWLLTVALEVYLGGHGRQVWLLAVVSGLIFIGGLIVLKVLGRRPHIVH
ncbi:MAG: hypothetical protein IT305_01240 [Chloroflexi bacterium]|nr:hypothetical protein [Chloroflexota bacterium]